MNKLRCGWRLYLLITMTTVSIAYVLITLFPTGYAHALYGSGYNTGSVIGQGKGTVKRPTEVKEPVLLQAKPSIMRGHTEHEYTDESDVQMSPADRKHTHTEQQKQRYTDHNRYTSNQTADLYRQVGDLSGGSAKARPQKGTADYDTDEDGGLVATTEAVQGKYANDVTEILHEPLRKPQHTTESIANLSKGPQTAGIQKTENILRSSTLDSDAMHDIGKDGMDRPSQPFKNKLGLIPPRQRTPSPPQGEMIPPHGKNVSTVDRAPPVNVSGDGGKEWVIHTEEHIDSSKTDGIKQKPNGSKLDNMHQNRSGMATLSLYVNDSKVDEVPQDRNHSTMESVEGDIGISRGPPITKLNTEQQNLNISKMANAPQKHNVSQQSVNISPTHPNVSNFHKIQQNRSGTLSQLANIAPSRPGTQDGTHITRDFTARNDSGERETPTTSGSQVRYEANWASLDSRQLPGWYDDAKFGIFIHWGVFSVPAFGDEWFWYNWKAMKSPSHMEYMKKNYRTGFKYADFVPDFTADYFNSTEWADLFEAAGARYVVLTSKHHEGFTNWPCKVNNGWNSVQAGPGRDLVGELSAAIKRKSNLRFGLYHSLYEWFNPLYLADKQNDFTTQYYVAAKVLPSLYELVGEYEPEVLWSDGDWEAPDTYWNSTAFLAWLYNHSPVKDTVVTNDRWGRGLHCRHGDFFSCPDISSQGRLLEHKWENYVPIDKLSWGYRKTAPLSAYRTTEEILSSLVQTVSFGGNFLLNIGPTADGRILPIFEERLRQIGSWLRVNGEAIYGTQPWRRQRDSHTSDVWYTSSRSHPPTVYAVLLSWPSEGTVNLSAVQPLRDTLVVMLGVTAPVRWTPTQTGITVRLPTLSPPELPSRWAWVLKLENIL